MSANTLIRLVHRWLSIVFTVAVIATTIALNQKTPIMWMSYAPLAPLALMFLSGMYLFFLPYVGKRAKAGAK